ncbi:conjugal transfer protein TrbL, partial [Streptococcus agalactiae]|nr:conjugal transfer protein TrbL [Streptococcus agalactiae]MDK8747664.1 conjugal transfer protein TrbL [Streptococcus agalactiae]
MIMNFTSSFVYLASEKVSSDSLFEGFQVDLESTANLVKSLADFNPTVWSYMTAITKGIMQPLGVA